MTKHEADLQGCKLEALRGSFQKSSMEYVLLLMFVSAKMVEGLLCETIYMPG